MWYKSRKEIQGYDKLPHLEVVRDVTARIPCRVRRLSSNKLVTSLASQQVLIPW